ncbi:MAG TPA: hypothetical protein VFQ26_06190 [Nitrospiraceae bacterium]|nr:hypothetical protein [Nitrospiraceae bacterium]
MTTDITELECAIFTDREEREVFRDFKKKAAAAHNSVAAEEYSGGNVRVSCLLSTPAIDHSIINLFGNNGSGKTRACKSVVDAITSGTHETVEIAPKSESASPLYNILQSTTMLSSGYAFAKYSLLYRLVTRGNALYLDIDGLIKAEKREIAPRFEESISRLLCKVASPIVASLTSSAEVYKRVAVLDSIHKKLTACSHKSPGLVFLEGIKHIQTLEKALSSESGSLFPNTKITIDKTFTIRLDDSATYELSSSHFNLMHLALTAALIKTFHLPKVLLLDSVMDGLDQTMAARVVEYVSSLQGFQTIITSVRPLETSFDVLRIQVKGGDGVGGKLYAEDLRCRSCCKTFVSKKKYALHIESELHKKLEKMIYTNNGSRA